MGTRGHPRTAPEGVPLHTRTYVIVRDDGSHAFASTLKRAREIRAAWADGAEIQTLYIPQRREALVEFLNSGPLHYWPDAGDA